MDDQNQSPVSFNTEGSDPVGQPPAKQKTNIPFLIILFLAIWVWLAEISLVVADIRVGALHGAAETGYGFVFAIFLSPITIGLTIVSLMRAHRLKAQGYKFGKTIKIVIAAVVALSLVAGVDHVINKRLEDSSHKKNQAKVELLKQQLADKPITAKQASDLMTSCKAVAAYVEKVGDKNDVKLNDEIENAPEGIVKLGSYLNEDNNQVIWMSKQASSVLKQPIATAKKHCTGFRT